MEETNKPSSRYHPTEEQNKIYATIKPPNNTTALSTNSLKRKYSTIPHGPNDNLVCITAGAGSGKSTTIINLAAHAARQGHDHITYITFAKAAADDGCQRISQMLQDIRQEEQRKHQSRTSHLQSSWTNINIDARTFHSCAFRLLDRQRDRKDNKTVDENDDDGSLEGPMLNDDSQLDKYIARTCKQSIRDFMRHAERTLSRNDNHIAAHDRTPKDRIGRARQKVIFFIRKTLQQFCKRRMTLEEFQDEKTWGRDYYPAQKYHHHQNRKQAEKDGFDVNIYKFKFKEYANMACAVWKQMDIEKIRSHDIGMKKAQLKQLHIPATLLLVDECQDLDECQMDWIICQAVEYKTRCYIVGDAAQTIYSFRGAKSKYMTDAPAAIHCSLTKSWRFGTQIARLANVALFLKEYSPQTIGQRTPIWNPYRLRGCDDKGGIVTDEDVLHEWDYLGHPITYLAATNRSLMMTAVSLFGLSTTQDNETNMSDGDDEEDQSTVYHHVTQSEEDFSDVDDEIVLDATAFPKMHINGSSENSGFRKWTKMLHQIKYIYELYVSKNDTIVLPRNKFPEFHGRALTWNEFVNEVETREMGEYFTMLSVVQNFGRNTMIAMNTFKKEVLDKNYDAEQADVILSTVHAAKGMEWDAVQICDDVFSDGLDSIIKQNGKWQIGLKCFGDTSNVLYVACSRSKKILSIPPKMKRFLSDFDMLHEMICAQKLYCKEKAGNTDSNIVLFGRKRSFTIQEALDVYLDLVHPLRQENNLTAKDFLLPCLLQSISIEKTNDGKEAKDDSNQRSLRGEDCVEFDHWLATLSKK